MISAIETAACIVIRAIAVISRLRIPESYPPKIKVALDVGGHAEVRLTISHMYYSLNSLKGAI